MDNFIPIDLHCHSTHSDGAFSVHDLLDLAKNNGGKYLALTDHDTVIGINQAKDYASQIGLELISGVEISVTWNGVLIHIVGLKVNQNDPNLVKNLDNLRSHRYTRGEKIAKNLEKIGIPDALEGALRYASSKESLSRTHFNRFLIDNGYATAGNAFKKFLAPGKPGYVANVWASLEDAVTWINSSGGIAVIAHPCRYKLTRTKLLKLIDEFKQYGGIGIEVISSSHSKEDVINISEIAHKCDLFASVGSDFHYINQSYCNPKVGINPHLPEKVKPIFSQLNINL